MYKRYRDVVDGCTRNTAVLVVPDRAMVIDWCCRHAGAERRCGNSARPLRESIYVSPSVIGMAVSTGNDGLLTQVFQRTLCMEKNEPNDRNTCVAYAPQENIARVLTSLHPGRLALEVSRRARSVRYQKLYAHIVI